MKFSSLMAAIVSFAVVIGLTQFAEARCGRGRCNFGVVTINAPCHTVAGTACEAGRCTTACSPGGIDNLEGSKEKINEPTKVIPKVDPASSKVTPPKPKTTNSGRIGTLEG